MAYLVRSYLDTIACLCVCVWGVVHTYVLRIAMQGDLATVLRTSQRTLTESLQSPLTASPR